MKYNNRKTIIRENKVTTKKMIIRENKITTKINQVKDARCLKGIIKESQRNHKGIIKESQTCGRLRLNFNEC